ncbi:hypothetical protein LTY59_09420 [Limosilactobacillus balticus]|uniref:1,4-beta-N-acetylmuramidase n=1 Tax=Limosilactobacillus balticus TaxID=2759747 RepID=A0ABS8REF6_9LACO|nr:GH25 family lysozyme [Limosilactobacillus balticus]MCD7139417.1 hypothetical protein [Limosilactobacillus balticus]
MKNKSLKKAKNLALAIIAGAFLVGVTTTVEANSTNDAGSTVTWKNADGQQLKDNWLYKYGNLYYFNKDGYRLTNKAQKIDGNTYYFGKGGEMVRNGFNTRNGATYYYDANGNQVSNYFYNNWGHTYYFGKDGKRYTNQFYNNWGRTYYFGSDGARLDNSLYTNWGHQYYFGSDGALITNTDVTINGVTYHADKEGILTPKQVGRSYGGDYSKYQPSLYNNTGQDSFAVSQIGGSVNGTIYDQYTYSSHAQQAKSNGWRFHTYIWMQTGSNQYQTQQMLNYFLTKIQAPYGSIVALDYEAGASGDIEANTDNILLGMRMIKQAGFTPMLYSYKPYLLAHVDLARINAEFPNSLWVAGYQNGLSTMPNYGNFPSLDNVAMWQYSDYGGQQDLNVDLTGITYNGY